MDFKLSLPITLLFSGFKKSVMFFRKNTVKDHGKLDVSRVVDQGEISSFSNLTQIDNLTVRELSNYFYNFLENNISSKYLKDGSPPNDLDKLPNDKKLKFIVNNTRISTFFIFTDGERVALFDRSKSNKGIQKIQNDRFDVFGSVTFENSSLKLKITNDSFLNSKIEKIEGIPGLAFEDSIEPDDNLLGRQTVIMIGFSVYVSPQDLDKSQSNESSIINIYNLSSLPDEECLTSKAKLGIDFLKSKIS